MMSDSRNATRMPLVDVARGCGIVMMVLYHAAWDLSWFGYLQTDVGTDPLWKAFAWLTAGLFLVVVGVSLVLGTTGRGVDRGRFLRRLAVLVAAAAAVSLATRWLFGDTWVFFGILHHIAVASVLGLAFLRLPAAATAMVALLVLAMPRMVSLSLFDLPGLQWLGLGTFVPASNDFVPLFPWFAPVLAGIVVGRLLRSRPRLRELAARPRDGHVGRWLRLAGRHSLLIYLLHQPLLYGATSLLHQVWPPPSPALSDSELMQRCVNGCRHGGGNAPACELRCACAERTLMTERLWRPAMSGTLAPEEHERTRELLAVCPPA